MSEVILYTDERTYDVTPFTTSFQIQLSLTAPYEQALIELMIPAHLQHELIPFYEETGAIDLDTWVVIRENIELKKRAIFCGRLSAVSYGVSANEEGLVEAAPLQLNFTTWLAPLIESQIYLSATPLINGHIYEIQSYGRLLQSTLSSVFENNIGEVLRTVYNHLSPAYRFPKTLAGGARLSSVPIISSRARAEQYAPERAHLYRGIYGLALNATQIRPTGAPWSILSSFFDVDPTLIELFPSLEPAHVTGSLSDFLDATPVIMYRLKPFIFGRLTNQSIDPNAPSVQEHAQTVERIITANEIIRLDLSVNAQDRINSAYVETPLNEQRGIDAFGLIGSPSLNREDIEQNGLRMYRGQWPFFPQGRSTPQRSLKREIDYIISIVNTITINNHRYLQGSLTIAQRPDLRAGLWVKVEYPQVHQHLIVYIETVTHTTQVIDQLTTRRSSISFTRGFYQGGEHHD